MEKGGGLAVEWQGRLSRDPQEPTFFPLHSSIQSYSSCPAAKAFITFPASSVGLAQKFVWVFP